MFGLHGAYCSKEPTLNIRLKLGPAFKHGLIRITVFLDMTEDVPNLLDQDTWQHGVKLFNDGHYWECHEALEPLWLKATGQDKDFYAGMILLAAALHKARAMNSARGGRRNYAKALAHLALIPDHYRDLDVRALEANVHSALSNPQERPKL
jgi:uncharacterized protein